MKELTRELTPDQFVLARSKFWEDGRPVIITHLPSNTVLADATSEIEANEFITELMADPYKFNPKAGDYIAPRGGNIYIANSQLAAFHQWLEGVA